MNKYIKSIAGMAALCSIVFLSSCDKKVDYSGVWEARTPVDVTVGQGIAASYVTTLDIQNDQNTLGSGVVRFSDKYNISDRDSVGNAVNLTAVASADGTWQTDIDDADDILMKFDYSTIKIDVNGDSAKVASWKPEIERMFRQNMTKFSVVEDMEVKDNGKLLSLEIDHQDMKLFFDRVEPK